MSDGFVGQIRDVNFEGGAAGVQDKDELKEENGESIAALRLSVQSLSSEYIAICIFAMLVVPLCLVASAVFV